MITKPATPPAVEALTPEQVRHLVLQQYAVQLRRIKQDYLQGKAHADRTAAA